MAELKTSETTLVRSLDRGLRILDTFMTDHVQTLNQVTTKVDLPKSTAHRLLMTLESRGYISSLSGESGTYRLGIKGIWFTSVRSRIHRELERFQQLTGETVNFGAIVGDEVEYIDRILSDHALRWGVDVGSRIQMHSSGMGKAILAFREDLVPDSQAFKKQTDYTISNIAELRNQFEMIRRQGFAVDDEEFIIGVLCIAAPVRNECGEVIGAVSVSGPSVRFTKEIALAHAPKLLETAAAVSAILGYADN